MRNKNLIEFDNLFGSRIANALFRNGIFSTDELVIYAEKHPFYKNKDGEIWKHIGFDSYKKIENYLNERRYDYQI